MMKKLYLATALVCAIFTLGCSSSASADSPAGVVKAFYKAMNAENYTAAADCILYDGEDIEKDKAMMTEILSTYLGPSLKQLGGVQVEILSETIGDNGEATVEFNMKNGKGQDGKETAKCARDASGAWKMRPAF